MSINWGRERLMLNKSFPRSQAFNQGGGDMQPHEGSPSLTRA